MSDVLDPTDTFDSVYRFACWQDGECIAWTNLASEVRDHPEYGTRRVAAAVFAAECCRSYGHNLKFYYGNQSEAVVPHGQEPYYLTDLCTFVYHYQDPDKVVVICQDYDHHRIIYPEKG